MILLMECKDLLSELKELEEMEPGTLTLAKVLNDE